MTSHERRARIEALADKVVELKSRFGALATWAANPGPQAGVFDSPAFECLYGGAAGGGAFATLAGGLGLAADAAAVGAFAFGAAGAVDAVALGVDVGAAAAPLRAALRACTRAISDSTCSVRI